MSADPYERLAELAEAELALCEEGRFEDLGGSAAETEAIVATLPAQPAVASAALRARGIEDPRGELVQLGRGRDAARSYAASAGA